MPLISFIASRAKTFFALAAAIFGVFATAPAMAAQASISGWGDSLTAGSSRIDNWPYLLSIRLHGRTVNNFGVPGQVSSEIAARQGALIAQVTVAENQIAAVEPSPLAIDNAVRLPGNGMSSVHGSLAGVPGKLRRHADNNYFTRDWPGRRVEVPPGTPFLVDDHRADINVIWAGRNDINVNDTHETIANIEKMAARATSGRFIVLSVLNGANEGRGTAKYATMKAINDQLAARYPQNYLDVRALLVNHYDSASATDRLDHAEDVPPQSLRTDTQHLKPDGYAIVAHAVAQKVTREGW